MASLVVLFADVAPMPPVIPEVQAVSSNEEIILMWDNKAESSIDPFTGYSDFEGYRIYRSNDGGQTWGKSWNRIYDYSGNHVAWKPYAQFDLIEESDSLHCMYSNGYLGESGERCYSKAIPYISLPSYLLDDDGIINVNDSIVYLPNYIRGSCPIEQEHTPHPSSFAHQVDCFSAGNITSFDPMASWISLGDNDSLKRVFIDTDVLDGVQYTYAVTAFDIGMETFKVEFISTDINTEVEDYCNGDDSHCNLSDNYCNGDDSYCEGMECCSAGGCCKNDVDGIVNYNKENCNLLSGIDNHIWLPDIYMDEATCEYVWQDIDHGYEDYSTKGNCEDFNYEWVVVEYDDEESCEGESHEWIVVEYNDEESCKGLIEKFEELQDKHEIVNIEDKEDRISFNQIVLTKSEEWKTVNDGAIPVAFSCWCPLIPS